MTKKMKITTIIMAIISVLFIILSFTPKLFINESESTTVKFDATFLYAETKNDSYIIYTEEYSNKLMINDKNVIIDLDSFNNINANSKIYFRVKKEYAEKIDDENFIFIITLESDTELYVSFESYNKILNASTKVIQIIALSIGITLLVITIIISFCLLYKKN